MQLCVCKALKEACDDNLSLINPPVLPDCLLMGSGCCRLCCTRHQAPQVLLQPRPGLHQNQTIRKGCYVWWRGSLRGLS